MRASEVLSRNGTTPLETMDHMYARGVPLYNLAAYFELTYDQVVQILTDDPTVDYPKKAEA